MAKRKQQNPGEVEPVIPQAQDESIANSQPAPASSPKPEPPRLSFPVKDGRIDWDGMREGQRQKLREMIASESGTLAVVASVSPITEEEIGYLLDLLGPGQAWLFARALGLPPEAAKVFLYTEDEKKVIGPQAAKVLSKYLKSGFGKYKDEISLGLIMCGVFQHKIGLALEIKMQVLAPAAASVPISTTDAGGPANVG